MGKKQGLIIFGISLVLLFSGTALATSSPSSDVIIYDQNPAGRDKGNEQLNRKIYLINLKE